MNGKPLILLTNDDGIDSPPLNVIFEVFSSWASVLMVAPDRERSATSHAITLDRPLRVREKGPHRFAVDGTPADCVYLGSIHLANRPCDLVVSGPNRGLNLGTDVFYSGTVAAAAEAAVRGHLAVAVSMPAESGHEVWMSTSEFTSRFAQALLERRERLDGFDGFFNINVPKTHKGSCRWTRLGRRKYAPSVVSKNDPKGKPYYWIGGPAFADLKGATGEDAQALSEGLISVTPLHLDMTSQDLLERMEDLSLEDFQVKTCSR